MVRAGRTAAVLRAEWQARLEAGRISADPAQEAGLAALDRLQQALAAAAPADPAGGGGLLARLGLARRRPAPPAPAGIYLWGGVGRGKSMLMDLFFETTPIAAKRRVHFNAFMLEIHQRIHAWRRSPEARKAARGDPVAPLADAIAGEIRLLCFDEFHVVDIADAMILGRLFEALLDRGVTIVATSNWPPRRLYEGGLQRDRFLPFIALVERRMEVVEIAEGRDFRLERLRGRRVWLTPPGPAAQAELDAIFDQLADGAEAAPRTLRIGESRTLVVPKAARRVAQISFAALCDRPLGAADYLALADAFDTILIEGIPRFTEARRNEMKRFIVLIDSLYESRRRIAATADAPPQGLYAADSGALEFARTESRLMEMQSAGWLDRDTARAA